MRFLFVDRIVELSLANVTRGIKHVTPDDTYLCHDNKGRGCFIPSLIGETLGQLAAWNVMAATDFVSRPVAGVVSSACLYRPAYIGETLLLESFIDELDDAAVQYHSVASIGDEVVFTIDGALGPLLPMGDFIDSREARRQFDEIYREGDWAEVSQSVRTSSLMPLLPTRTVSYVSMSFDAIVACEPKASLVAEKKVSRAAPYFPDHFPNKPVLPLTVLLECQLNLAREFLKLSSFDASYSVSQLRKIKMSGFVLPGDVVRCSLVVKSHETDELILQCRCDVGGKRVCVLEMVLSAGVSQYD